MRPCRRLTGHQASAQEVEARYAAMPPHMQRSLMPFQRVGVRFGLGLRGRVLIADEMGVGKTVQAIALASCYRVRAHRLMWASGAGHYEAFWRGWFYPFCGWVSCRDLWRRGLS